MKYIILMNWQPTFLLVMSVCLYLNYPRYSKLHTLSVTRYRKQLSHLRMTEPAFDVSSFELPGQYEYRGILYGTYHTPKVDIDMMKPWQVDPTDVMIATYPKSGKQISIHLTIAGILFVLCHLLLLRHLLLLLLFLLLLLILCLLLLEKINKSHEMQAPRKHSVILMTFFMNSVGYYLHFTIFS